MCWGAPKDWEGTGAGHFSAPRRPATSYASWKREGVSIARLSSVKPLHKAVAAAQSEQKPAPAVVGDILT